MMNKEPVLRFQPWRRWASRGRPAVAPECGGVYLFAHCASGRPPAIPTPDALPKQVVYIGDSKNLNNRPLTGRHHRIARYKDLFGGSTDFLFVTCASLYRTGCDDYDIQRIFSFYAEAMLVWNYTKRHGHPPVLHWKEKEKGRTPEWVKKAAQELSGQGYR